MARKDSLSNYLTDIAIVIKNKLGITSEIIASEFDTKIREISTGTGINGKTSTYTAGGIVTKGKFVKLVDGKVKNIESTNDTILGIAKTSGISGQTVEVVEPDFSEEEN